MITMGVERGITIATLNYDNTIEMKASEQSAQCNTGLQDWVRSGTIPCYGSGIDLIKLHGSVNWLWGVLQVACEKLSASEMTDDMDRFIKQATKSPLSVVPGQRLGVIFGGRNN